MKNIYGNNLQQCELKNKGVGSSSMPGNTCSEASGGVHQICVKNIGLGNSFSKATGQSDWSCQRGDNNHCACLGAWALYVAKGNKDKEVKCEAIPETIFNKNYLQKWSTWNGNELDGQARKGIDSIYQQCIEEAQNESNRAYLDRKYKYAIGN